MASRQTQDPVAEQDRLMALRAMNLLDTTPTASLDQITRLASQIFGVPISLITLIDAHRQWFKSSVGMGDTHETSRDDAFCNWTIEGRNVMVVEDATRDPRFADSALVQGRPHIVFYAGAPAVSFQRTGPWQPLRDRHQDAQFQSVGAGATGNPCIVGHGTDRVAPARWPCA